MLPYEPLLWHNDNDKTKPCKCGAFVLKRVSLCVNALVEKRYS